MALELEPLSSNHDLFRFIIYDTISITSTVTATQYSSPHDCSMLESSALKPQHQMNSCSLMTQQRHSMRAEGGVKCRQSLLGVQGKKKRRRKPKVCKNKEEAEAQRMTHIAVERNRRKQMNEHLVVLRSLMPESYVQRGDQASTVGGAIEFVKELERHLQFLEAQKLQLLQAKAKSNDDVPSAPAGPPTFAQFFMYPHYSCSQLPNSKYTIISKAAANAIADIEVILIETHANLRILSRKSSPRHLSKLVAGFQTVYLSILHINVTTLDPFVLYSISAKLEEGCLLTSAANIAAAVHHMLTIIEEETAPC